MFSKEVTLTVADTKSPKWKRLCPPDDSGLGPMGIKATELPAGTTTLVCVLRDAEAQAAYAETLADAAIAVRS